MWLLPLINGYWTQIGLGALMFAMGLQRWQRLLYGKAAMFIGVEMAGACALQHSTVPWEVGIGVGIAFPVALLTVREGLHVIEDGETLGFGYVGTGMMMLDYSVWTLQHLFHASALRLNGFVPLAGHTLFVGIAIAALLKWVVAVVRKEGYPLNLPYDDLD
jgi:hypothetical protein